MPVRLSPDPGAGVFETMLVVDGVALEEEAHRKRLMRSLADLYDARVDWPEPPGGGPQRWRVDVRPSEAGLVVWSRTSPVPRRPDWGWTDSPARLSPVAVEGGLGRHKWRDRRELDGAVAALEEGGALLVDADEAVLETDRASVVLVEARQLVVSPRSDAVLPGVTLGCVRDVALDHRLHVVESPLTLSRLLAADEVLLTGSLRGVEPVGRCGDREWTRWSTGRQLGRWLGEAWSEQIEDAARDE